MSDAAQPASKLRQPLGAAAGFVAAAAVAGGCGLAQGWSAGEAGRRSYSEEQRAARASAYAAASSESRYRMDALLLTESSRSMEPERKETLRLRDEAKGVADTQGRIADVQKRAAEDDESVGRRADAAFGKLAVAFALLQAGALLVMAGALVGRPWLRRVAMACGLLGLAAFAFAWMG